MIVTCPECSSRFIVSVEAIGENGRKVKCAKCHYKWFQKPDAEALESVKEKTIEKEPTEIDPVPYGSNVPVAKEKPSILLKSVLIASVMLFLIALSLNFPKNTAPYLSLYYNLFGIYDTKNIELTDIEHKKYEKENNLDIYVKGKIINKNESLKKLPNIKITVLSKDNENLKEVILSSKDQKIKANDELGFENTIRNLPLNADKIIIDLGNRFELLKR